MLSCNQPSLVGCGDETVTEFGHLIESLLCIQHTMVFVVVIVMKNTAQPLDVALVVKASGEIFAGIVSYCFSIRTIPIPSTYFLPGGEYGKPGELREILGISAGMPN